jgi:ABC-2 type transport system permease protein
VTVPKRPARAGIDPRHLLIDVNPEDNTVDTKTEDAVLIGRH